MTLPCTAIVVTYNSQDVISECLGSLGDAQEILVVDNASTDGTLARAASAAPRARVIRGAENRGFGAACNLGLAETRTPHALIINPDARLEAGALSALIACAGQYADAGIIAPLLRFADGGIQESYRKSLWARERDDGRFLLPEGPLCADFLSGAVMLLRMEMIRRIGGFDPNIFLYYEDDDFCLRAKKAGFSCILEPTAAAIHRQGASSAAHWRSTWRKQHHLAWSRLYLERKYKGGFAEILLACRLILIFCLKIAAYGLLLRRDKLLRHAARIEGCLRFLSRKPSP